MYKFNYISFGSTQYGGNRIFEMSTKDATNDL